MTPFTLVPSPHTLPFLYLPLHTAHSPCPPSLVLQSAHLLPHPSPHLPSPSHFHYHTPMPHWPHTCLYTSLPPRHACPYPLALPPCACFTHVHTSLHSSHSLRMRLLRTLRGAEHHARWQRAAPLRLYANTAHARRACAHGCCRTHAAPRGRAIKRRARSQWCAVALARQHFSAYGSGTIAVPFLSWLLNSLSTSCLLYPSCHCVATPLWTPCDTYTGLTARLPA